MEFIFIAKLEPILSQSVQSKEIANKCPVGSKWKLAGKEHKQYKAHDVVLISEQNGKCLGLSVEDTNYLFDIIIGKGK